MVAVANVYETLDETSIRKMVLPKLKLVFEKNQSDIKIMANVLNCIERTLDKLDKSQVNFDVFFFFLRQPRTLMDDYSADIFWTTYKNIERCRIQAA